MNINRIIEAMPIYIYVYMCEGNVMSKPWAISV